MSQETASVLGNSYRIYSLKYIYSLLVPGILESRMSQETASILGNSYQDLQPQMAGSTASNISRIPIRPADIWSCKVLAK